MNLTVKTIIKWKSMDDMGNPAIVKPRADKLAEMISQQKTDGVIDRNDANLTGTIKFIDNAAGQEWIDFVTELTKNNNITLASAQILPV